MKNRLGIGNDPETLRSAERMLSGRRAETVGEIRGNFDQQHLRDIHQHLFQDVYEWAGTMRQDTIELEGETIHVPDVAGQLSKGSTNFLPAAYLDRGLNHVSTLANSDQAKSNDPEIFADAATKTLNDLNHAHPFRDGNGRTQRAFVEQLADRAGYEIDFHGVTTERNVSASIDAHQGDTTALNRIVVESMDADRVALRMQAVDNLDRAGYPVDEFWVETAQDGDHISGTVITAENGYASLADDNNRFIIVPRQDMPVEVNVGQTVTFDYERGDTAAAEIPYIEHALAHSAEDRVNPPFDDESDRQAFAQEIRDNLSPADLDALKAGDAEVLRDVREPSLSENEQLRLALLSYDHGDVAPDAGARINIIERLSDNEFSERTAITDSGPKHF
ncbi:Fic/DOC family protein [Phaeobacter sp. JH20_18]|uniref:Fic/DOC family protein n=1 Tax=Phaeobacter sp. JH20_18 TaxID=3112476 RepID=UPI003A880872